MVQPQKQQESGGGTATAVPVQAFRIVVRHPDGQEEAHDISPENNLIVGSSPNCSIRLNESSVAAMHCLIRLYQGRLSVQDWYTTAGTFLNGRKLEQPTEFSPGDDLRIGEYRLRAEVVPAGSFSRPPSPGISEPESSTAGVLPAHAETMPEREAVPVASSSAEEEHAATTPGKMASFGRATEVAIAGKHDATADLSPGTAPGSPRDSSPEEDIAFLQLRIEELEAENEHLRQMQSPWDHAAETFAADPADLELLELLKSEVEQLQEELDRKDAQLSELTENPPAEETNGSSEEVPDRQTEKLVARLEQLLDELQRSDERAALLEELLQAAEEATHAEQQERQQLAAWVGDIETRIVQREAEWQAQQEVLQKQIEELREERQRNEQRLREISRRHASSVQARLIAELQQRVAELESQLQTAEESREALRKVIDSVEFQRTVEGQKRRVEELLRAERLQLAEEHAQLARERAELARLKTQLHKVAETPQRIDEATCRVRAFREHLKEIHEQEAATPSAGGLSSRLAKLWQRLENW